VTEWPPAPTEDSAASDTAVIERVLAGHTDSFGILVSRYQTSLYRYAAAMVLDRDVAADLVQDTFVRAYVNLSRCRDPRAFRAWIARTLRHRCIDYFKEARRRDVRIADHDHFVDPHEQPDVSMARRQIRMELRQALARLSDAQREAFILHCVEGVPYEVMAEVIGASVSALKMRVMRAREALGAALADRHVTDLVLDRLYSRPG